MECLYIVDTAKPFMGHCENTMNAVPQEEVNATKVHHSDLTFEQYNKEHGGTLVALDWDDFNNRLYTPHLLSLQEPFVETTEERYEDGLECLPPKRWTRSGKNQFFFVGECYTANIYRCFVRKEDKYYTALRAITTSEEDIFNLKNI